jgi:desulfoferrodoxin (superoxide reductase-like protein)
MDKILQLQSEIYIKINSINEHYRSIHFIHFICSYISKHQIKKKNLKKWKNIFNNTMKTLLRGLNM